MLRRASLLVLAGIASGCVAITHPARVTSGWTTSGYAAYDSNHVHVRPENGEGGDATGLRVQAEISHGTRYDADHAFSVGVVLAGYHDEGEPVPLLPYAALDLYYQFQGASSAVDVGVGALVGYYPGAYLLVGRDLGSHLRLDAGIKATIGFDDFADDARAVGPFRELTPQIMLSARAGEALVSLFAEYSLYRIMEGGLDADYGTYVDGGFSAGLGVTF